jgi:outer membrane protein assembly factor BamB
MPKLFRLALVAALALPAAACNSTDDIQDAIQAINPFGDSKKALTGERVPVLTDNTPVASAKTKGVSIGAPRSVSAWTGAGGPAGNDPGNVAIGGSGGSRIWSAKVADVDSGGMIRESVRAFSRPVAYGGRAYVLDPAGNVTAVSLANGGTAWRTNVKPTDVDTPATTGGLGTDGSRVYAATAYGTLVALDADSGAKVWEKKLSEPARGAPTVADGRIFVVSQANIVYALSATDGSELWNFRGVPEIGSLLATSNPAVSAGVVVAPFTSGELVALDVKSGQPVWGDALARASRNYAVSGLSTIAASPVIADGVVYATGVGSRTVAVNLKTGARLWDIAFGSAHTPAVSGNAVFLVDLDENLTAIDRHTGAVIWASKLPVTRTKKKRTNWAGPVLAGGTLWLASNDGTLLGADPTSGRVSTTVTGGESSAIAPIVVDGKILVLGAAGSLAAYQ